MAIRRSSKGLYSLIVVFVASAATVPLCTRAALAQGAETRAAVARTGVITGSVRDDVGHPLPGAEVSVGALVARVDSNGAFALRGVPLGLATLTVRRLGFHQIVSQWDLGAEPLTLDLMMIASPLTLPTVTVHSRAQPYDSRLAGYNERRAQRLGYYITQKEIEAGNTFRLTDALRRVPGVKVQTMSGALGTTVTLPGAQCPPLVFVDGFAASLGRFDLDMIDLATVEGVEIYPNGSSVPAAFMGSYGTETCGVIAIWSRPMRPNVRANQRPPEKVNLDSLLATNTVYLPDVLDAPASYIDDTARPLYPDSLYRVSAPGRAVARFVVDSLGVVEWQTVQIISATRPEFAAAVREAIRSARFKPGMLGGRPVRSIVELPFDFSRPPTDSVPKGG